MREVKGAQDGQLEALDVEDLGGGELAHDGGRIGDLGIVGVGRAERDVQRVVDAVVEHVDQEVLEAIPLVVGNGCTHLPSNILDVVDRQECESPGSAHHAGRAHPGETDNNFTLKKSILVYGMNF